MELETGNGSSKPVQTNQGEKLVSSSSSSSFDSSLAVRFGVGQEIPESLRCEKSSNPYSFVHSNPGSSASSPRHNQLIGLPGYDPKRIPSSVFTPKPTNPSEWSIASNESLFSIQTGNASFSREHGLAAMIIKMGEIPEVDETVNQKTDTFLVPPPLVEESGKPTETAQNLNQKEDSESDSGRSDDEKGKEKEELVEPVHENKPKILPQTEKQADDVRHSTSMSCHSDTSNTSSSSFAFPLLDNDDGVIKIEKIDSRRLLEKIDSRRPQQQQQLQPPPPPPPSESKEKEPPYPARQQSQPNKLETQPQPYPQLEMHPQPKPYPQLEMHKQSQPQQHTQPQQEKKSAEPGEQGQTQTPTASEGGWFSFFFCCSPRRR